MTTQRLAKPQGVTDLGRTSPTTGVKGRDEPAHYFVLGGFILMLIGVVIGVVGKTLLHEDIVTVVGVLIALAGVSLEVYPYLVPSRRKVRDSSFTSQPEVLTPPQSTEYLPDASRIEYVPSITERPTNSKNDKMILCVFVLLWATNVNCRTFCLLPQFKIFSKADSLPQLEIFSKSRAG